MRGSRVQPRPDDAPGRTGCNLCTAVDRRGSSCPCVRTMKTIRGRVGTRVVEQGRGTHILQVTEPVLAQNMHRKDLSAGASIGIVSPDMSYLALSEKSRGTLELAGWRA